MYLHISVEYAGDGACVGHGGQTDYTNIILPFQFSDFLYC